MKRVLLLGILFLGLIAAAMAQSPPSSTFPKATQFYDKINADEQTVMLINDSNILFSKITFTLNKSATRARLIVQAMPDCPENAPNQPSVLQCFFVSSSNFESGDVKSATIDFKVSKAWLDANKFDKSSIDLKRYSYSWNVGGQLSEWKKLDTFLENGSGDYAYYSSDSDGIDYFSIVSDGTLQTSQDNVLETAPTVEQPFTNQSVETHKYSIETAVTSNKWLIDGRLVTVLVLMLLAIFVFRLRYSEHLVKPEQTHEEKHLEYLTDTVEHFAKAGYSHMMIKNELKRAGWPEWMIDFASIKAKRLK